MKRLFVGIEMDEEARREAEAVLVQLQDRATRQGVRFVKPEKLHLTLEFLGAVDEASLPALDEIGRSTCNQFPAMTLSLQELGGFPSLFRPKVLWLGVREASGELSRLQGELARAIDPADREAKEYRPHITLARISPGSKEVGRLVNPLAPELGAQPLASWCASEVVLFESTSDGRYAVLSRWPLRG